MAQLLEKSHAKGFGPTQEVAATSSSKSTSDGPSTRLPAPPVPCGLYKDFLVYSDLQLADANCRQKLTEALHSHYHKAAGGRKFLYVHEYKDDGQSVSKDVASPSNFAKDSLPRVGRGRSEPDSNSVDVNFCLLQQNVRAGMHGCNRVLLWIKGATIDRYSAFRSTNFGSLYINIPTEVQSLLALINQKFSVDQIGDSSQLKVRCELDESCYPRWVTEEAFSQEFGHYLQTSGDSLDVTSRESFPSNLQKLPVESFSSFSQSHVGLDTATEQISRKAPVVVTSQKDGNHRSQCGSEDTTDVDCDVSFASAVKKKAKGKKTAKLMVSELFESGKNIRGKEECVLSKGGTKITGCTSSPYETDFPPLDIGMARHSADAQLQGLHTDQTVSKWSGQESSKRYNGKLSDAQCFDLADAESGVFVEEVPYPPCLSEQADIFEHLKPLCVPKESKIDCVLHLAQVCPYQQSHSLIVYLVRLRILRCQESALDKQLMSPVSQSHLSSYSDWINSEMSGVCRKKSSANKPLIDPSGDLFRYQRGYSANSPSPCLGSSISIPPPPSNRAPSRDSTEGIATKLLNPLSTATGPRSPPPSFPPPSPFTFPALQHLPPSQLYSIDSRNLASADIQRSIASKDRRRQSSTLSQSVPPPPPLNSSVPPTSNVNGTLNISSHQSQVKNSSSCFESDCSQSVLHDDKNCSHGRIVFSGESNISTNRADARALTEMTKISAKSCDSLDPSSVLTGCNTSTDRNSRSGWSDFHDGKDSHKAFSDVDSDKDNTFIARNDSYLSSQTGSATSKQVNALFRSSSFASSKFSVKDIRQRSGMLQGSQPTFFSRFSQQEGLFSLTEQQAVCPSTKKRGNSSASQYEWLNDRAGSTVERRYSCNVEDLRSADAAFNVKTMTSSCSNKDARTQPGDRHDRDVTGHELSDVHENRTSKAVVDGARTDSLQAPTSHTSKEGITTNHTSDDSCGGSTAFEKSINEGSTQGEPDECRDGVRIKVVQSQLENEPGTECGTSATQNDDEGIDDNGSLIRLHPRNVKRRLAEERLAKLKPLPVHLYRYALRKSKSMERVKSTMSLGPLDSLSLFEKDSTSIGGLSPRFQRNHSQEDQSPCLQPGSDCFCTIGDLVEIDKSEKRKDIKENQKGEIVCIGLSESNEPIVSIRLCKDDGRRLKLSHNVIKDNIPLRTLKLLQKAEAQIDQSIRPLHLLSTPGDLHRLPTGQPITPAEIFSAMAANDPTAILHTGQLKQQLVATPFSLCPPRNSIGILCFFWDLEATGLDIGHDEITQIACVCRRFHFGPVDSQKSSSTKTKDLSNGSTGPGVWETVDGYPDSEFNCYVHTERTIPEAVVELTGITNEFLDRHGVFNKRMAEHYFVPVGVSFQQAMSDWHAWILTTKERHQDCPVWFVAHNGNRYDLPLLFEQECLKLGQPSGSFLKSVGAVGIVDTVILSRRLQWGGDGARRSHKLQTLYHDIFHRDMPNEHDALGDVTGLAELMAAEPFLGAWRSEPVGWGLTQYVANEKDRHQGSSPPYIFGQSLYSGSPQKEDINETQQSHLQTYSHTTTFYPQLHQQLYEQKLTAAAAAAAVGLDDGHVPNSILASDSRHHPFTVDTSGLLHNYSLQTQTPLFSGVDANVQLLEARRTTSNVTNVADFVSEYSHYKSPWMIQEYDESIVQTSPHRVVYREADATIETCHQAVNDCNTLGSPRSGPHPYSITQFGHKLSLFVNREVDNHGVEPSTKQFGQINNTSTSTTVASRIFNADDGSTAMPNKLPYPILIDNQVTSLQRSRSASSSEGQRYQTERRSLLPRQRLSNTAITHLLSYQQSSPSAAAAHRHNIGGYPPSFQASRIEQFGIRNSVSDVHVQPRRSLDDATSIICGTNRHGHQSETEYDERFQYAKYSEHPLSQRDEQLLLYQQYQQTDQFGNEDQSTSSPVKKMYTPPVSTDSSHYITNRNQLTKPTAKQIDDGVENTAEKAVEDYPGLYFLNFRQRLHQNQVHQRNQQQDGSHGPDLTLGPDLTHASSIDIFNADGQENPVWTSGAPPPPPGTSFSYDSPTIRSDPRPSYPLEKTSSPLMEASDCFRPSNLPPSVPCPGRPPVSAKTVHRSRRAIDRLSDNSVVGGQPDKYSRHADTFIVNKDDFTNLSANHDFFNKRKNVVDTSPNQRHDHQRKSTLLPPYPPPPKAIDALSLSNLPSTSVWLKGSYPSPFTIHKSSSKDAQPTQEDVKKLSSQSQQRQSILKDWTVRPYTSARDSQSTDQVSEAYRKPQAKQIMKRSPTLSQVHYSSDAPIQTRHSRSVSRNRNPVENFEESLVPLVHQRVDGQKMRRSKLDWHVQDEPTESYADAQRLRQRVASPPKVKMIIMSQPVASERKISRTNDYSNGESQSAYTQVPLTKRRSLEMKNDQQLPSPPMESSTPNPQAFSQSYVKDSTTYDVANRLSGSRSTRSDEVREDIKRSVPAPTKHFKILKRPDGEKQDGKMTLAAAIAGLSYDVASESFKSTTKPKSPTIKALGSAAISAGTRGPSSVKCLSGTDKHSGSLDLSTTYRSR